MSEESAAERTRRLAALDQRHVWHPFTAMQGWMEDDPLIIERGEGCELIDTEGRRYLDGVSSLWVNVHGHGHPALDAAIADQLGRLAHSTFLGLSHPPAIELAARLVALAPGRLERVFFSENGAASVEVALKMAYSYWRHRGEERPTFVRLENAYHGDTIGAVSIGGIDRFHETYRPLLFATASIPSPYCYRCPLDLSPADCGLRCADALEDVLAREGDSVAAVVIEPLVQGAAGIITAPDGHLRRVADIARRHGVLLVVDEVANWFGRTGKMFACEHEGIEPDILCLAKGLTGGYLPLSATLATAAVFDAFLARPEEHKTLYHGHSYSANPLCCAAALANLDVFESEKVLDSLPGKVSALAGLLAPLAGHPHVGEIRQRGLMVGIELVADRATKEPFPEHLQVGAEVARATRPRGAIVRPLGDVVVLMPPPAMTEPELSRLVTATAEAIDEATTAALASLGAGPSGDAT
ncbi:MAG TPA: adenosylmethionine--8-amino-7-oxononanoate transaminase [Acidimicrobiia bacterium]|nr:adenosylmethionine--8-amino-7-oxononanoate transaminase [Acidimicrobiia bacterium]